MSPQCLLDPRQGRVHVARRLAEPEAEAHAVTAVVGVDADRRKRGFVCAGP